MVIEEEPAAPQEAELYEVRAKTAKLKWAAPFSGNAPLTKYAIQWKREKGMFESRN